MTTRLSLFVCTLVCLVGLSLPTMFVGCSDDNPGGSNWDLDNDAGADADPDTDPAPDTAPDPDTDPDPDAAPDPDASPDADPSECDERNPSLDCRDTGCSGDQTCIVWEQACTSSNCECMDGQWMCTRDCDPQSSVCVDDPNFCDDENLPSKDCRDYGCEDGMNCELDEDGCLASSCQCDPVEQSIGCTSDCGERYECVTEVSDTCNGMPNPAGCSQTGCPDDQTCVNDTTVCAPSSCSCGDGGWICTDDCGGGGTCE